MNQTTLNLLNDLDPHEVISEITGWCDEEITTKVLKAFTDLSDEAIDAITFHELDGQELTDELRTKIDDEEIIEELVKADFLVVQIELAEA